LTLDPTPPWSARARLALGLVLLSALSGCGLLRTATSAPARLVGGDKKPAIDPLLVQQESMLFADAVMTHLRQATEEFAAKTGTVEGRIQAYEWWIAYSTRALVIATRPQPVANAVELLVTVSLQRALHERYWKAEVWGEADQPLIDAFASLETSGWRMVDHVLDEGQRQRLRDSMTRWLEENPDLRVLATENLGDFPGIRGAGKKDSTSLLGEVFGLASLDPWSGLEPTVREVKETRQFAERALFYAQRVPLLLAAQVELLMLRISEQPAVKTVLEQSERLSKASESVAATAAALPEVLRTEREAALRQIADELTAQREGLVADLEKAREPLQALLTESRGTLEAGRDASRAIDELVKSLDAFIGQFKKPEPEPGSPEAAVGSAAPPTDSAVADADQPPKRPFDIRDYGEAAAQIGVAAQNLEKTIATLDSSLPQVQRVLDEAATRGERTVDHAFRLALWLLGIAIVGTSVAVVLVRRIAPARRT